MPPARHLSLGHRKSLLPMTLTDRVFAERGVDAASDPVARAFRDAVGTQARLQLDVRRDDERLDVAVPAMIERAAEGVRRLDPAFDEVMADIASAARACACTGCCGGGRVCEGGRRDDAIVAEGGRCLSEFKEAAEAAAAVAEHYYATHSVLFREAPRPVAFLSSGAVLERPHSYPGLQLGIGASTIYGEDGGRPSSEVALYFQVLGLDRFSVLAVPYVLLHEHLCHVFQCTHPNADGRRGRQHFDTFAEGWMDHVVMVVMAEVAEGPGPTGAVIDFDQLRAAREVHLVRSNAAVADRPPRTSAISMGVRAAVEVEAALVALLGRERGRSTFLSLSFDLNVMDGTTTERHAVVTTALRALTTRTGPRGAVLDALAGYAGGGGARRFLEALNLR